MSSWALPHGPGYVHYRSFVDVNVLLVRKWFVSSCFPRSRAFAVVLAGVDDRKEVLITSFQSR